MPLDVLGRTRATLMIIQRVYSLGRQARVILKFHRDGDRSLQLLVFNEEFLVSATYRLNGPVKCSDRGDVGGSLPATSREVH
ncbi:hypothetical protein V6N13_055868 [Hibiscus sabdariffa]